MNQIVTYIITGYFILINIITFAMFGVDKNKARKHKWRTPEKVLLSLCILGGAVGGLIGMKYFRHKTKHPKFYICVVLGLILWTFIFYNFILRA